MHMELAVMSISKCLKTICVGPRQRVDIFVLPSYYSKLKQLSCNIRHAFQSKLLTDWEIILTK